MASDQIVGAQDVLRALHHVRHQGLNRIFRELEPLEPDLCDHLLEETTLLHSQLRRLSLSSKQLRRLHQQVQELCCVLVLAQRYGYQRLLDLPATEHDHPAPPPQPPGKEDEA